MRGGIAFSSIASKLFKLPIKHWRVGAAIFGMSIFSLSGCVAYDPYPPSSTYYYSPAPYYAAPSPSYYYYQPCCTTYFDFGYSHGYGRHYYGHRHH